MLGKLKLKICRVITQIYARRRGVVIPRSCQIYGICKFLGTSNGVNIGENVIIRSGENGRNIVGINEKTVFKTMGGAQISIGNNVGISNAVFACSAGIKIGDNVLIGGGSNYMIPIFIQ